ncbi:MAG: polysaccharide deacetylase family protein [Atopobiaceae bacterium]|nr:polysaccharide deacetylase family protein [Atopobiaceae bacterium]
MSAKHSGNTPAERPGSSYGEPAAQGYVNPYESAPRRRGRAGRIIAALLIALVLAGAGAGAYFFFNPPWYKVTVNGELVTVKRNATIGDVIADGHASPNPGNLLAIDGNVAIPGGGNAFVATVNGTETTDPSTTLSKDDQVQINDGTDATETFTTTEEVIPHGTIEADTSSEAYWGGSLHVYEKGEDGLQTTKTGDVSGVVLTEVTKAPVDSGYHIYTANTNGEKKIALTFDDGPWPGTTDQILDILQANGARATFFTIGEQVAEYPEAIQREAAVGCQVCTHTWDHASGSGQGVNLTYMTADEQINEVQQGFEALRQALGTEPQRVMRAPGGNYYGDIISTLEPYVDAEIGWDVDTMDWSRPGAEAIYQAIMTVQPGQVVLMHDGGGDRSQTVEAISRAIPELIAQGYELVTVNDLLAYGHNTSVASDVQVIN